MCVEAHLATDAAVGRAEQKKKRGYPLDFKKQRFIEVNRGLNAPRSTIGDEGVTKLQSKLTYYYATLKFFFFSEWIEGRAFYPDSTRGARSSSTSYL